MATLDDLMRQHFLGGGDDQGPQPAAPDPMLAAMQRSFAPSGPAQPFDLGAALGVGGPASPPSAPASLDDPGLQQLRAQLFGGGPPAPQAPPSPLSQLGQGVAAAPAQVQPSAPLPAAPVAQRGKPLTNEQLYSGAAARQEAAVGNEAQAKANQSDFLADNASKAADALRRQQEEDFQFRQKTDADIAAKRQQLEAQVDQLANTKMNPNRVIQNQSTLGNIVNVIGLALGGFLAPVTGGRNPAADAIAKQVDDDMKSQAIDLETRSKALGAKGTLLQMDIAQGHDAYDARTKATAAAYDTVISQIKAEASRFDSPQIQARAQGVIAGLEQKKAETFEQWQDKKKELAIAGGHLALAQKQFDFQKEQAQAELSLKVQEALQKGDAAKAKALQDNGEKAVWLLQDDKGQPFVAPDKERATKANELVGESQKAISALDRLMELRQQYGAEMDNPLVKTEGAKALTAARIAVVGQLKAQFGTRFTEAEANLIEQQIGSSATSWRDNTVAWKEMRDMLVRNTTDYLKSNVGYKSTYQPLPLRPPTAQAGGTIDEEKRKATLDAAGQASMRQGVQELEQGVYGKTTPVVVPQGQSPLQNWPAPSAMPPTGDYGPGGLGTLAPTLGNGSGR